MFDQNKYVNSYIKKNYKTISLRIRNDELVILNKLNSVDNVNKYIKELILKDAYENRVYNYINNDIVIDFEVTRTMKNLIDNAEEADLLDDYGRYMNFADAIDTQAKNECKRHILTESQWDKLAMRYVL